MLRAAVIGCGRIGSEFSDDPRVRGIYTHAGAYAAHQDVELVAVCDVDPPRAGRAATRWGLRESYVNVEHMLRDVRPDLVSVCSPDETHAEVLRAVLKAESVRGVLAEKPLAMTTSAAKAAVDAAIERGVALVVNYFRRYAPGHVALREAIRRGELGEIQAVLGVYSGGVVHNGSHWFDLLRWMVGEPTRLEAHTVLPGPDPTVQVRLELEGGGTALLQGCDGGQFGVFEMDIIGTTGRARLCDSGHRIERFVVGDSPHYSGFRALLPAAVEDGGLGEAMVAAVDDLVAGVRTGRDVVCSGFDGLAALRLSEAARVSAIEMRSVDVGAAK